MGESVYIYSLNCPDTGEVKYVGKTIDRKNRLNSHIWGSKYGIGPKDKWIQSLLKDNKKPVMVTLEVTKEWEDCEKKWIKYYREKGDIFNIADGGLGLFVSPDMKKFSIFRKVINRYNSLYKETGNENFKKYAENFRKMRKQAIKNGSFDEFEDWLNSLFGRAMKNET